MFYKYFIKEEALGGEIISAEKADKISEFFMIDMWWGILVGLILLAMAIMAFAIAKKVFMRIISRRNAQQSLTIETVRKLRQDGQISDQEYEVLISIIIQQDQRD